MDRALRARPVVPVGGPGGRKFFRRKKVCKFTVEKIDSISYRDVRLLQQFVSDRGKIIPRRLTGTSAPFQRKLTKAIKQARAIALLPYAAKYLVTPLLVTPLQRQESGEVSWKSF